MDFGFDTGLFCFGLINGRIGRVATGGEDLGGVGTGGGRGIGRGGADRGWDVPVYGKRGMSGPKQSGVMKLR